MSTQISNCYYHPERGSVATCAKCGVGICKDCAIKDDGKILCYQCENEILKQEHKEYRKQLKANGGRFSKGKEFIVPGIIGLLMVIAAGVLAYFGCFDFRMFNGRPGFLLGALLFFAYLLFSTPFCYIVLSDLFASKCDTIYGLCLKCYFKLFVSLLFGWIVFTFFWIRFIFRKVRARRKQAQHVDNA